MARMGTVRYRTRATVAAFSPDGKWLATSPGERTIDFWDPPSGRLLRQLTIPSWGIKTLAFSPDGKILASGGDELFLWEASTGKKLQHIGEARHIFRLAFSPNGKLLASCSKIHSSASGIRGQGDRSFSWPVIPRFPFLPGEKPWSRQA